LLLLLSEKVKCLKAYGVIRSYSEIKFGLNGFTHRKKIFTQHIVEKYFWLGEYTALKELQSIFEMISQLFIQ
jgi:hypothetical protein